MVDQVQRQSEHRRGDARAATGHDRLRQVDTGLAEAVGEGRRGQQGLALGIEQVREWNIAAAWYMAAAQYGTRLLLAAVEAAGGAGIDDLLALACEVALHLREVADHQVVLAGGEMALPRVA